MLKKVLSVILPVIILSTLFIGCASNSNEPTSIPSASAPSVASGSVGATAPPTNPPSSTPSPTDTASDYKKVYAEYLAIFRDNQWDIAKYDWQMGDGQAAICDITGDATPELLFITASDYEAKLSVYQYNHDDGTASRVYFETIDVNAGSGTFYCLFTTTDSKAILYERSAGEERLYSYKDLMLNPNGRLAAIDAFTHRCTPSEDYSTFTDRYARNGAEISESEFATLESELVSSMKDVVIWSCTEEDGAVWDKISEIGTSYAMPAEDAIELLVNKAGVAGEETPGDMIDVIQDFTEEAVISYMTPAIMNAWSYYIEEAEIPDNVDFVMVASDRLYDGWPIYLVGHTVSFQPIFGEAIRGKHLVFADGTTMGEYATDYAKYSSYFDAVDITAEWPFD